MNSSEQDEHDKLKRLLNASGFAFQLALEAAVRSAPMDDRWQIGAREHPWSTSGRGYTLQCSRGLAVLA